MPKFGERMNIRKFTGVEVQVGSTYLYFRKSSIYFRKSSISLYVRDDMTAWFGTDDESKISEVYNKIVKHTELKLLERPQAFVRFYVGGKLQIELSIRRDESKPHVVDMYKVARLAAIVASSLTFAMNFEDVHMKCIFHESHHNRSLYMSGKSERMIENQVYYSYSVNEPQMIDYKLIDLQNFGSDHLPNGVLSMIMGFNYNGLDALYSVIYNELYRYYNTRLILGHAFQVNDGFIVANELNGKLKVRLVNCCDEYRGNNILDMPMMTIKDLEILAKNKNVNTSKLSPLQFQVD